MIAVTNYEHAVMNGSAPLKYPERHATSLGKVFESAGFQVDYLLGPKATRENVTRALGQLSEKGSSQGICVVGFFGHGVQMTVKEGSGKQGLQNHLCPYDSDIRNVLDANGKPLFTDKGPALEPDPDSLICLNAVLAAMKTAKAGKRLAPADCCRDTPMRARNSDLGFGTDFKASGVPTNSVILFGCGPGQQSFELDEWQHGAFSMSLLNQIGNLSERGEVTTGALADAVRNGVVKLTDNRQRPTVFASDGFRLLDGKAKVLDKAIAQELPNGGISREIAAKFAELKAWKTAEQSAMVFRAKSGELVIMAVGRAKQSSNSPQTACEHKAFAALLGHIQGIDMSQIVEVTADDNLKAAIKSKLQGHVKTLPMLYQWESDDKKYLSILYGQWVALARNLCPL